MGTFTGVNINKLKGGLVRESNIQDRTILLVIGGTAIAGKLVHYKPVKLTEISDLENYGYNATLDDTNSEMIYYHIDEYFRLSPDQPLWVMIVPKTEKVSTLVVSDLFVSGVRSINGINTIGICGLAKDDVLGTAIQKAQSLVGSLKSDYIYIDSIFIEGLGSYLTTLDAAIDLRSFDSETVSVVIGQDPDQASKKIGYANYAVVGSALGMLSVRYVHENIGSVDIENHPSNAKGTSDYPLTSVGKKRFINASLSNGTLMSAVSRTMQDSLTQKGYIFAGSFQGYAGFYFNNSSTCTSADSAYAYIEYNCVWNKAARIIRNTLIPRIRSKVESDPRTGYISNTTISDWDARIRSALSNMISERNISDFDIYINPKQMAVSNKPFTIKVQLVADGVVNEFEIDLGFTNKI